MRNIQTERSELSALGIILLDDVVRCRKMSDEQETDFELRIYYRAFFALVEGITHRLRLLLLASNEAGYLNPPLTGDDISKLQPFYRDPERQDNDAQVSSAAKPFGFLDGFKFVHKTCARAYGIQAVYEGAMNHQGFGSFRECVKIRDRITHPHNIRDIRISHAERQKLEEAHAWYVSLLAPLLDISMSAPENP